MDYEKQYHEYLARVNRALEAACIIKALCRPLSCRADIKKILRAAVESVEGVACDLNPEFMGDRRKMEQAVRTSGDCRMYQDRVLKAFHGHDIARTHIVHLCELYGLFSGLSRIV